MHIFSPTHFTEHAHQLFLHVLCSIMAASPVVKGEYPKKRKLSGGYRYKFLECPPEDLLCAVCKHVARQACQMNCCGSISCKVCLEGLVDSSKNKLQCPGCSAIDDAGKWFADRRSEKQVKALKICCPSAEHGCGWEGRLAELETHVAECEKANAECPNPGCGSKVARNEIEEHKRKCSYRKYKCRTCKMEGAYGEITTTHLEICPMTRVSCPNHCHSSNISRFKLPAHLSICANELVSCTYVNAGCSVMIQRQDLSTHLEQNMATHLQMAMETNTKLALKLKETEEQLEVRYPPVTFKIPMFRKLKESRLPCRSANFYSHPDGYKMCIVAYPYGKHSGFGTSLSVFVHFVRGSNDEYLTWPFRGKMEIELLNQVSDTKHHSLTLNFSEDCTAGYTSRPIRVLSDMEMSDGWGFEQFFPFKELESVNENPDCQYFKDDCLYIRLSNIVISPPVKSWLQCSSFRTHVPT